MQRIRQRKYGRDGASPHAVAASHVIKIGFDARKPGAPHPLPGKLRGFLLCKDTLDENNMLMVDMESMGKYGVTREKIAQAKQLQLKAPPGLLPTDLHFVLVHDAKREAGRWVYPGTFGEEYETWGKLGRFCHGDGVVASRRQDDGTRQQIECVPRGKEGTETAQWCPYSVSGECRARSRLVLCLFFVDPAIPNTPKPISDSLGWQARFRFDTTSEYNPMRVLAALDEAANRLQGNLSGIPGTLSFLVQRKRTGNEKSPVGIVGQIMISLSESEIAKRERELWERQIEERRAQALPSHGLALPESESPAVEREEEPEVIVGDDEPDTDPAPGQDAPVDVEPNPEPEAPAAQSEAMTRAVHARDTLLRDYPGVSGTLAFELSDRWGVQQAEDLPEDALADAIEMMRDLWRDEHEKEPAQ